MRTQRNGSLALALSLNLLLAVAGLAGCAASKCADGSCDESASGFELQACKADADCKDGLACLPERCDATCVPDAAGACQACNAEGSGLCMPRSTDSGTAPVAPACFAGRLGDLAACDVDVDWGRKAVDTCAAQRAELIDLHALLTCPDGRPGGVVFTCCSWDGGTAGQPPSTELPDGKPPVTEPPSTDACVRVTVRVDVLSPDPVHADPKMAAEQQCRAMGLQLRDVQVQPDSAGAPQAVATATCCKPASVEPPPDHPEACREISIPGDPNVEPKEMAVRICNDQNLVLTDLKPLDVAPDGTILAWMASCCGDAVQPPATDPTTPEGCVALPVKVDPANPDPMYNDPKMGAYEQCRAMGLELRDLQSTPDSSGAPVLWTATCCKPASVEPPADDPSIPGDACTDLPVGDGTCDATLDLKGQALQRCQDLGATLKDLRVRFTCADGTVGALIATCCR